MKIKKLNIKGFSHFELAIVLLVVFGLGIVGYRVLKNTSHAGSSISSAVPTPTNLQVNVGNLRNTIIWDDSTDSKVNAYEITRNGIVIAHPTDSYYVDTNVKAGVNYTYKVSALENYGSLNSLMSNFIVSSVVGTTFSHKNTMLNPSSNLSTSTDLITGTQTATFTPLHANVAVNTLTEKKYKLNTSNAFTGYSFKPNSKFFQYVSGTFIVPPLSTCTQVNYDYASSIFVNLDGKDNNGFNISANCDAKNKPSNWSLYVWREGQYDSDNFNNSLKISTGNTINFSYQYIKGKYLLTVVNVSKNLTYTTKLPNANKDYGIDLYISLNAISGMYQYSGGNNLVNPITFSSLYASDTSGTYVAGKTKYLSNYDNFRYLFKDSQGIQSAETYPLPIGSSNFTITKSPNLIYY